MNAGEVVITLIVFAVLVFSLAYAMGLLERNK